MTRFHTNFGDEFLNADRPQRIQDSTLRVWRQFTDESVMPFGPYQGRKMKDVPAAYLDSLRDKVWLPKWPAVEDYVTRAAKAINRELELRSTRTDESCDRFDRRHEERHDQRDYVARD